VMAGMERLLLDEVGGPGTVTSIDNKSTIVKIM
jgi:hypothetical protein